MPLLQHGFSEMEGQDGLMVDKFLGNEPRGGKHAEAPVVQLLCLAAGELGRGLRLQAEGVKAEVTGVIAIAKFEEGRRRRLLPAPFKNLKCTAYQV